MNQDRPHDAARARASLERRPQAHPHLRPPPGTRVTGPASRGRGKPSGRPMSTRWAAGRPPQGRSAQRPSFARRSALRRVVRSPPRSSRGRRPARPAPCTPPMSIPMESSPSTPPLPTPIAFRRELGRMDRRFRPRRSRGVVQAARNPRPAHHWAGTRKPAAGRRRPRAWPFAISRDSDASTAPTASWPRPSSRGPSPESRGPSTTQCE